MGSRAYLDILEMRKILHLPGFEPQIIQLVEQLPYIPYYPGPQNFTLEWATNAQPWPIYPLETNPVPTIQEDGWIQEPVTPSAENLVPRDLSSRSSNHSKLLY